LASEFDDVGCQLLLDDRFDRRTSPQFALDRLGDAAPLAGDERRSSLCSVEAPLLRLRTQRARP
jgi:hypothetical protein